MFILALALGKSIKELMNSMTEKEYFMWYKYYTERPFGDIRDDYRSALSTQILASPYMKESKPIGDFLLQFGSSLPSDEELATKMDALEGMLKRGR